MKLILVIFIFLFCNNSYSKEFQNYYNVKYISNYDGDTFTAKILLFKKGSEKIFVEDNVRIKNINTPEIKSKNLKERKKALKAKAILKERLTNAEKIDLLKCERDKYGRLLCELFLDGKKFI